VEKLKENQLDLLLAVSYYNENHSFSFLWQIIYIRGMKRE